jgi:hypothetical protein
MFCLVLIAATLALAVAYMPDSIAQNESVEVPLPPKAPVIPDLPDRNPVLEDLNAGETEAAEEEDAAEQEEATAEQEEADAKAKSAQETYVEEESFPADGEVAGMPPLPSRRSPAGRGRVVSDRPIGPAPLPTQWSEQEITEAKAQCENLLSGAIYEFEPLKPVRNGVCGTPAPVELNAVSAGQTVAIRPAAKLNCRMASHFQRWMVEIVQPSAKTHLETEIAGVVNVASYHCRTRYNDPTQRMSQHAFFNALDLSAFITAKGAQITIEKSWEGDTPESRFLKEIHAGACKIFGTVLGPEANAAHRDHFHLDMTKRRHSSYCQ